MAEGSGATVQAYLARLPPERRTEVAAVRRFVKKHLPAGYREGMSWGAVTYHVPLSKYPTTYNGQPLCYVALAAQKKHLSLYLMAAYGSAEQARRLRAGFAKAGKRLDMGKSCLRFQTMDDLALDAVAGVIASTPMARYIAFAESVRTRTAKGARTRAGASGRARF